MRSRVLSALEKERKEGFWVSVLGYVFYVVRACLLFQGSIKYSG